MTKRGVKDLIGALNSFSNQENNLDPLKKPQNLEHPSNGSRCIAKKRVFGENSIHNIIANEPKHFATLSPFDTKQVENDENNILFE